MLAPGRISCGGPTRAGTDQRPISPALAVERVVMHANPIKAAVKRGEAFGEALADLGADERIVVLDGDVNNSTFTNKFMERYPDRFFNVGIAESNLVGIAGHAR